MSPRKSILKELDRIQREQGSQEFTALQTIPGFDPDDLKHTSTVNQLLRDRLINGTKGADGRMQVALNASRLGDVRRELRAWYARPSVWTACVILVGMGAAGLLF